MHKLYFLRPFLGKKNEHTIVGFFPHAYTDGHTVSVQCRGSERERERERENAKMNQYKIHTDEINVFSVFYFFICFSSKILLVALAVMTDVATSDMGTKKKKLQM